MQADLEIYGLTPEWSARFDDSKKTDKASLGRVVRQDRGFVLVATADGVLLAALRPKAEPAVVGDWVGVEDEAVVVILERKSLLARRDAHSQRAQPIVANVDVVFVVCGLDRPINTRRIERAITQTRQSGATPIVVLTKSDLVDDAESIAKQVVSDLGSEVCIVSSRLDQGLQDVRKRMQGNTSVLIGESGAGKSSLVNALLGEEFVLTGEVRKSDSKGRHTTTRRELHLTPSGILIDTPGIRALGLWADEESVAETFAEVAEVAEECRFSNCAHGGTPGCAIALAIDDGTLTRERVEAWITQMDEIKQNAELEKQKTWRSKGR